MQKLTLLSVAVTVALAGCSGDDGKNGQNGIDGTNGLSSLVLQTQLAVGDTVCRNGGVKIDSGLDADGNGALSNGEVSSTEHVCAPSITSLSAADVAVTAHNTWFSEGESQVAATKSLAEKIAKESGKAKNVILSEKNKFFI